MPPDPPEYQPAEDSYSEVWARVYLSRHVSCDGWTADGRDGVPVCVCGIVLEASGRAAA
jgi:hypothetical protein